MGDGTFNYNCLPFPTDLCDLCAARTAVGREPTCVHHCLANVMYYGPVEELARKLGEKTKQVLFVPQYKPLEARWVVPAAQQVQGRTPRVRCGEACRPTNISPPAASVRTAAPAWVWKTTTRIGRKGRRAVVRSCEGHAVRATAQVGRHEACQPRNARAGRQEHEASGIFRQDGVRPLPGRPGGRAGTGGLHCGGPTERIVMGAGEVPRGIEEALYDMEIGEQRDVVVPCAKAYGEHDPEGVVRAVYLRSFLAEGATLHVGDLVAWEHPVSHQVVPVKVVGETEDTLTVDFNHLLAGKDLAYRLELGGRRGRRRKVASRKVSVRAGCVRAAGRVRRGRAPFARLAAARLALDVHLGERHARSARRRSGAVRGPQRCPFRPKPDRLRQRQPDTDESPAPTGRRRVPAAPGRCVRRCPAPAGSCASDPRPAQRPALRHVPLCPLPTEALEERARQVFRGNAWRRCSVTRMRQASASSRTSTRMAPPEGVCSMQFFSTFSSASADHAASPVNDAPSEASMAQAMSCRSSAAASGESASCAMRAASTCTFCTRNAPASTFGHLEQGGNQPAHTVDHALQFAQRARAFGVVGALLDGGHHEAHGRQGGAYLVRHVGQRIGQRTLLLFQPHGGVAQGRHHFGQLVFQDGQVAFAMVRQVRCAVLHAAPRPPRMQGA